MNVKWEWSKDGMWLYNQDDEMVLHYTTDDNGLHGDESAKLLIASAPEMLEALKAIHRHIDNPAHYNRHIDALCEAAITKAEGATK